nr:uncharacterized protein LOC112020802 [Quercus suber]POF14840.1 hypothetical protein CFP56_78549 [Quercus suber]
MSSTNDEKRGGGGGTGEASDTREVSTIESSLRKELDFVKLKLEESSFVLVLIDAEGYIFDGRLVKRGFEGGEQAAEFLQQVVQRWMVEDGLSDCDMKILAYGNILGLSTSLHRVGLCGPEERSFASFATGFTQCDGLVDFIDSGERQFETWHKVNAALRHHAMQPSCRRIYFAGCHEAKYIDYLRSCTILGGRITLVDAPEVEPEFIRLGLPAKDLPVLFRSMQLEYARTPPPEPSESSDTIVRPEDHTSRKEGKEGDSLPCVYFRMGQCKSGEQCKFQHANVPKAMKSDKILPVELAETPAIISTPQKPQDSDEVDLVLPPIANKKKVNDQKIIIPRLVIPVCGKTALNKEYFAPLLVPERFTKPGYVGINSNGHRIDPYMPPPSKQATADFIRLHSKNHLCNSHNLIGHCEKGSRCKYDHRPISRGVFNMLKRTARSNPCRRKGLCRILHCNSGHICQLPDCHRRGGTVKCKMGPEYHLEDNELKTTGYVKGDAKDREGRAETRSRASSMACSRASPTPSVSPASNIVKPRQKAQVITPPGSDDEMPLIDLEDDVDTITQHPEVLLGPHAHAADTEVLPPDESLL